MPTPTFNQYLNDLATQAYQHGAAAAVPGVVRRPWQLPSAFPISTDVQDPAALIAACNRDDLNALAITGYQTGNTPNSYTGRIGVVMAIFAAIDHMGAYERALHARHASPVRLRAWAAARRAGHADMTYGVYGCVQRYCASLLEEARSTPNTQA
jgi:hypothetical protein